MVYDSPGLQHSDSYPILHFPGGGFMPLIFPLGLHNDGRAMAHETSVLTTIVVRMRMENFGLVTFFIFFVLSCVW